MAKVKAGSIYRFKDHASIIPGEDHYIVVWQRGNQVGVRRINRGEVDFVNLKQKNNYTDIFHSSHFTSDKRVR